MMMSPPVSSLSALMVSTAKGAAPAMNPLMNLRFMDVKRLSLSSPTNIVGTPGKYVGLNLPSSSMMIPGSGLGTSTMVAAP